ncbi:thiosulfate sulfurtransferase/rhodanese-like domain-containing protein 1 [Arapaima gigas]
MVLMVLMRRAAVVAADALGGTCGLKTSAVMFKDPRTDFVVTYEQLKTMLSKRSVQLFDVRNPDEFQAGRIPGSTNIPRE